MWIRQAIFGAALALAIVDLQGCATPAHDRPADARAAPQGLPRTLAGKVHVLDVDDAAYARAAPWNALKRPGDGGIAGVLVVRVDEDLAVYRAWNGPDVVDADGRTNRIGQWWSMDPPRGTRADYRRSNAVCETWNSLSWISRCRLRAGAVVAMGPGQSVSEQTCQRAGETYAPSPAGWQVYVDRAWERRPELDCDDVTADYPVDPSDMSRSTRAP